MSRVMLLPIFGDKFRRPFFGFLFSLEIATDFFTCHNSNAYIPDTAEEILSSYAICNFDLRYPFTI